MFQIKTFNKIAPEGLKEFHSTNYRINESENPHGIILRSQNLTDMEFGEDLLGIARAGAGVNNIPVDRCSEEGIVVFNTPGSNANGVKELAIASMISASRNLFTAQKWLENLETDHISQVVEENKKQFKGEEIAGKTLGVIGLGSIGHKIANDAYSLGMNVIGHDPYISVEAAWKLSTYVKQAADVDEVYANADFLTIHVPYTPDNHHTFNRETISKMKDGAVLMNFSRAELADSRAVIEALDRGKLSLYITDFPIKEMVNRRDVIMFPHLGASTFEAERTSAVMAVNQLSHFLETGEIRNSVNFPRVDMPFKSPARLTIINRNIPNMIGELTQLLANYNVNIEDFINRSKGDYAYNIVDISESRQDVLASIKERLDNVSSIIKVRIILNDKQ